MDALDSSSSYPIGYDYAQEIEEEIKAPKWALVFSAICAITISIIGCLCNLLTIIALHYSRKLRNSATWFIMNLALTEMVFCATILPMSAYHLLYLITHNSSIFSTGGCKFFVFLRYVIIMTEVFDIAAIAINRVILIAYPRKYHKIFNKFNTMVIIVGIWVASILMMFLPLFSVFGSFDYNSYTSECDFSEDSKISRKFYLLFGFILPSLLIIVSYSYIFYKANQSAARLHSRLDASETPYKPATGLRNRDMRIARVIAVIFLVFLVCCTPVSIAHYYGSQGQIPTLLLLLHPLYWLQYCLNMLLYVLMNKQYRDAYISFIAIWWPNFRAISARCYKVDENEASVSEKQSVRLKVEPDKMKKPDEMYEAETFEQQALNRRMSDTPGSAPAATSDLDLPGTTDPSFSGQVTFSNTGEIFMEDELDQINQEPQTGNKSIEKNRGELRDNVKSSSNEDGGSGGKSHSERFRRTKKFLTKSFSVSSTTST